MNKDKTLRLKVSVSPAYTELHQILDQMGPYYRSRRFLQLALLGVSMEKGRFITPAAPAPASAPVPVAPLNNLQNSHLYSIPVGASEAIANMFDDMDLKLSS